MFSSLLQLLERQVLLSDSDKDFYKQYFEPVHFPRNSIIEEEGNTPQYLYFVVSGFVRLFHYNHKGDEVTTHINCPPGFITSYFHFINLTKADENLECITDCELLRITKANLDLLTQQSTAFREFSISVFQQSISYNEQRSRTLATLTAEERYRQLIRDYPAILQNVPLQYIASFLGMNAKSLSRVRKQIIR